MRRIRVRHTIHPLVIAERDGLLEVTVRYISKVTFPVVLCILVIQTNQPIEGLTLS